MAKSIIKLPNGTHITIEGTTEEVSKILNLYSGQPSGVQAVSGADKKATGKKLSASASKGRVTDVLALVNAAKNSDDFDQMEKKVLDKSSQVDRVLLPLLIAERELAEECKLTSGDIYQFLKQFGINMALPNISRTLAKSAQKYVMADKPRKKGGEVHYVISRPGRKYIEQILSN